MFDKDFFPTPDHVAIKMWAELGYCSYVLEPSAGKGDLVGFAKDKSGYYISKADRIDVIERNPELQILLKGKGYNLIHDDFLTFVPKRKYDGIIMNPPFSSGAKHLFHAWTILSSGKIVCLLNAETVKNCCTNERRLLKSIIDANGSVTDLGRCFLDSERKTGVEVCMVVLEKDDNGKEFGFFDEVATDRLSHNFDLDESSASELAHSDVVDTMVNMYDCAIEAYGELLRAKNKVMFYLNNLSPVISQESLLKSDLKSDGDQYNGFVDRVSEACWDVVFEKTDIGRFVTSGIRKDFEKFRDSNKVVDFNRDNIEKMINVLGMSASSIMEEALVRVFDKLTSYDKKNTVHIEGWKTNDAWRVNKKVIIPSIVSNEWGNVPRFAYWSTGDILDDIDRVMCSLTGKNFKEIVTIKKALGDAFGNGWGTIGRSEFFSIRFYKKGTVHLTFLDENLLKDFNAAAANGKKWLPGDR